MLEETIYFSVSFLTVVLAVLAVWAAYRAMHKGLTYSSMQATVWALIFLAIVRLWHVTREIIGITAEWAEFIEYGIFIVAYIVFIVLAVKAKIAKRPAYHTK